MKWLFLLATMLLLGCPPAPLPPVNPPDASDAASPPVGDATPPAPPCEAACATLRTLGCKEGRPDDCVRTLARTESKKEIRTPLGSWLTCLGVSSARSVAEARAQGISCAP